MSSEEQSSRYLEFTNRFGEIKSYLDELGHRDQLIGGIKPNGSNYAEILRFTLRGAYKNLDISCFDAYIKDGKVTGLGRHVAKHRNICLVDEDATNLQTVSRWVYETQTSRQTSYKWNGFIYVIAEPFNIHDEIELMKIAQGTGNPSSHTKNNKDILGQLMKSLQLF